MSSNEIQAYAAMKVGEALVPYTFDAGELLPHQVEVKVEYCGLCHSDVSVINNEWHSSVYPVVAGHEVIGTITQLGSEAKGLKLGQRVGIGGRQKAARPVISVSVVSRSCVLVKIPQPLLAMRVALPIKSVPAAMGHSLTRRT